MAFAGAALVGAESILALTPVAIKKTPLSPISAIWSRILSSAVLGYALTGDRTLPRAEWGGATALGYTNLLHIASSYEAFRALPAGQAMSLLYTYPLWNLVFGALFAGERVARHEFGAIAVAVLGSALLNLDPGEAAPAAIGRRTSTGWGLLMGLVMALTESGIHTLLRGLNWRDPAKSVWVVSSSASLWLAGLLGAQSLVGEVAVPVLSAAATWGDAAWLTLFHSVTMFSGYWLRFYAVPRLSVVTYSILSYAGLLASYLFGLVFLGERPGWWSLVGALLIFGGGLAIQLGSSATTGEKTEEQDAGAAERAA
jgi:drug/metabolite transporter (DMT)-like permease